MTQFLPVLLLGVGGLLLGGALSVRRQGARWPVVGVLGLLAAIAAVGGVLWLVDLS